MTFPNEKAEIRAQEIEKTKAEIKVLEAKLSFLEELQNHKTLCEEAYKKVYGNYPDKEGQKITTGIGNRHSYIWWDIFQKGYNAAKEEKVSEYPYKKYTPEETEKSLKDAMKTAKADGVFDKPKPEPETLTLKKLLTKWEIDFTAKWAKNRTSELYEEELERFIQMFEEWLPDAVDDNVLSEWGRGCNSGFNRYRKILMGKLK